MNNVSHSLFDGNQRATKGKRRVTWLLVVGIFFAALMGGLIAAMLPWWIILMLSVPPLLLLTTLFMPEIAIIGILALLYGLMPLWISPQIPLGSGAIKTHEVGFLLVIFITLVRLSRLQPLGIYWQWLKPVLLFMSLSVTGILVSNFIHDTPIRASLSEARNQIFWLLVFVIIYLVQTEAQLKRLTFGIVSIAVLLSVFVVIQFVTGETYLHLSRVEELVTLDQTNSDVVRSMAGGGIYIIVFSTLLLLARLMTRSISMGLALPLLIILVASIVVTFGRGIWITTLLVSLLMAFQLMRWKGVINILTIVTVGIAIALALLASVKPAIIDAALNRAISATQETLEHNTSLGWRAEETIYASEHIMSNPFLGIGLGTSYKPVERMNGMTITDADVNLTRYIHNAYLGLWLKLGLLGPLAALWLMWGTIRRGLVMIKESPDIRMKSLTAASIGGFLVPAITSITQPEWLSQTGIGFFSLMLGVLICIHRLTPNSGIISVQRKKTIHSF
jgi:hypothetical protein